MKIQMNEPSENNFIEVSGHFLGPQLEKTNALRDEYAKELADDRIHDARFGKAYLQVEFAMKPGGRAKYEGLAKRGNDAIRKVLAKLDEDASFRRGEGRPFARFYAEDNKIICKCLLLYPVDAISRDFKVLQMPLALKEGLKTVDQFFKLKINLGADGQELLSSDKPIVEHSLKGFSAQLDLQFLKKIKKALLAGLQGTALGEELSEKLSLAGPGFSLGSNCSLDLKFKEMEELKAHPLAGDFLVTVD